MLGMTKLTHLGYGEENRELRRELWHRLEAYKDIHLNVLFGWYTYESTSYDGSGYLIACGKVAGEYQLVWFLTCLDHCSCNDPEDNFRKVPRLFDSFDQLLQSCSKELQKELTPHVMAVRAWWIEEDERAKERAKAERERIDKYWREHPSLASCATFAVRRPDVLVNYSPVWGTPDEAAPGEAVRDQESEVDGAGS